MNVTSQKIAEAYLRFLYAEQFPKLPLVTIDDTFGGWQKAQATHFSDGGIFDRFYGQ